MNIEYGTRTFVDGLPGFDESDPYTLVVSMLHMIHEHSIKKSSPPACTGLIHHTLVTTPPMLVFICQRSFPHGYNLRFQAFATTYHL